jgi:hypothetical protein
MVFASPGRWTGDLSKNEVIQMELSRQGKIV